jgi:predicted site-specific integrase-resolvase
MAAGRSLVAYERVSTARQGASGLGLEAQRKVIEEFAASRGAEVLARFTEVESGRKADRPELAKALRLAKVTGATLEINTVRVSFQSLPELSTRARRFQRSRVCGGSWARPPNPLQNT